MSSLLDGIDGSKAVDKTFLEVSEKIGKVKMSKNLFNAIGFDCDQELGEPLRDLWIYRFKYL